MPDSGRAGASVPERGTDAPGAAHGVLFYEREDVLLRELERYVEAALEAGGAAVAIATRAHLEHLAARLAPALAAAGPRYVAIEASAALARILDGGEPDAARFGEVVRAV